MRRVRRARDGMVLVPMAWIPLLLAGWFAFDVLVVAGILALARRRRESRLPTASRIPLPPPGGGVVGGRSPKAALGPASAFLDAWTLRRNSKLADQTGGRTCI